MTDDTSGAIVGFSGFDWDEEKRTLNIENHKIDFVDVIPVFSDPKAYVIKSRGDHIEERYLIIGRMRERTITVVFTRRGALVRLISARVARRNERQRYGSEK